VVLEWTNPGCPFVQKHYDSGNMQSLQKRFTGEGVQWIVINSTSPATPITSSPPSRRLARKAGRGRVGRGARCRRQGGRAYAAKVTPHMYVIDRAGARLRRRHRRQAQRNPAT